ncbi:transposase [Flammeovirgaceae bacterium 311]|nr:transposase [Flammeovirgaceae bacterium 311]
MSEYRKTYEGGLFFITCTVVDWLDVFTRTEYADELLNNLKYCQQHKGLELFAYVVMPNHIHMVASRAAGQMGDLLRDFKSFTAKRIILQIRDNPQESRKEWLLQQFSYHGRHQQHHKEYLFWQKTNYPVDITDAGMLEQKIEYIHQNPVRAGYVDEPQHWRYSSAYPLSAVKVLDT